MASKGEQKIARILYDNQIPFTQEMTFSDLKGLWGKPLRFDFYFMLNFQPILIEFQGAQHYQQTARFHDNRQEFLKRQEYDRIKASYALSHNMRLYTIPYWDLDNINTIYDLFKPEYLVKDRWHGDKMWSYYNTYIKKSRSK